MMEIIEMMKTVKDAKIMNLWIPILDEVFSNLKQTDPNYYNCIYDDFYETIYGETLSSEKAERLVKAMKPYGEHWSMSEVETACNGKGIDATKESKYYVMNMMYNDYHSIIGDDVEKYIDFTKAWLNDADAPKGDVKAYRYSTDIKKDTV